MLLTDIGNFGYTLDTGSIPTTGPYWRYGRNNVSKEPSTAQLDDSESISGISTALVRKIERYFGFVVSCYYFPSMA